MRSDHRWWAPVIQKRKEVVVEVQVIPYASGVEWHPRPKNRQQRRLWLRNQLVVGFAFVDQMEIFDRTFRST